MDDGIGGWKASAQAWIEGQGEHGDYSRREILDPCVNQILADVSGLKILDVGCGEGRYAAVLEARGALVSGIDPVEELLEAAKCRCQSGEFIRAFGESLPFEDQTFDIVLSYLTLIDIPGYREAIREMVRVMKPTGKIVIVTVSNVASTSDGWVKDSDGNRLYRTVDRYMEEFGLDLSWSGINVVNYHRPLSSILQEFFQSGVVLNGFWEPLPAETSIGFEAEFRVPTFQVMTFGRG